MIETTKQLAVSGIQGASAKTNMVGRDARRSNANFRAISLGPGLACLFFLFVVAASAGVARAQLNIPVIRGDTGLQ